MSEIEKLQRQYQECLAMHWRVCCQRAKALDELDVAITQRDEAIQRREWFIKERDKAIKERDCVRRMYCKQVHTASCTAEYVAYQFLWDCFHEETQ